MKTPNRSLLLVSCIALGGCVWENVDATYDSMANAISEGAVTKGWIPPWLPQGATNLQEVHNLDTNVSSLAFDIRDGTGWKLPAQCEPIRYGDTVPPSLKRSWWPTDAELSEFYEFFECEADASPDHVFVGTKRDGHGGLHWRVYRR
jgi:hypothetical protein